jgi:hypothetical protein
MIRKSVKRFSEKIMPKQNTNSPLRGAANGKARAPRPGLLFQD